MMNDTENKLFKMNDAEPNALSDVSDDSDTQIYEQTIHFVHAYKNASGRKKIFALSLAMIASILGIFLCFLMFQLSGWFFITIFIMIILLCVAIVDYFTTEIPNLFIYLLILSAFFIIFLQIYNFHGIYTGFELVLSAITPHIIGFFVISVPMLLLALIKNGAFGGGDIKLMAAVGLMLGWQHIILAFFMALLIGGLYAALLLVSKRRDRKDMMVFGPALCVGIFVSMLYGDIIINWYLRLFYV